MFRLLVIAGVVHKVTDSSGNGIPLGAESRSDSFKTVFLDVALGQALLGHDLREWILEPQESFVNKGEVTEAFVGQEILGYADPKRKEQLHFWQRDERTSKAEIDYLVQQQMKVVPVEVKSGKGTTLRSLHQFLASKPKTPHGIRFSTHNYSIFDSIYSYPLYSVASAIGSQKESILFLLNLEEKKE